MWEAPAGHPLRRMFAGLTEHAFLSNLGVADPPLIDYLSGLLTRFVHTDCVFRLRDGAGHALTELTAMAVEADKLPADGRARREYHRHVGDFALFWSSSSCAPTASAKCGGSGRNWPATRRPAG